MILLTALALLQPVTVQIDLLYLWIVVGLILVMSALTLYFIIMIYSAMGKEKTEYEQNVQYFNTKRALHRAIKEHEEGIDPNLDEPIKPKTKSKPKKKEEAKKEDKVIIDTSRGGFGDLSKKSIPLRRK